MGRQAQGGPKEAGQGMEQGKRLMADTGMPFANLMGVEITERAKDRVVVKKL